METAPNSKTYNLPAEIAVAITTGRPEMMTAFVKAIGHGERTLNIEETWSVMDFLKDVLADKIALQEKLDLKEAELLSLKDRIVNAKAVLDGKEPEDVGF